MKPVVVAIDAGTTGIRVNAYDRDAVLKATAYEEFSQHYPQPGWVEHDGAEIWDVTARLLRQVVGEVGGAEQVAAIGITNQRETTVVWDRASGEPMAHAIVWQDRRTKAICERHEQAGFGALIRQRTGLLLDAYFSATKLQWLIENDAAIGERAKSKPAGICFGTIDCWLAFKLSGGTAHVTDHTNASRTLLYDIDKRVFDAELAAVFGVPMAMLPKVVGSAEVYGETYAALLGASVPLAGLVGDQQGALFGQGCVAPGSSKNTYGTGCFALVNCGAQRPADPEGLVTTIACGPAGEPVYALEGSVFVGGAVVQWLRDGLGLLGTSAESEEVAATVSDTGGVYFVPAFVGLGAPYWDMAARGAILGLTRGTTHAHVVRAALEAICYQSRDLLDALETASGQALEQLRVDGGAVANGLLCQFQADILGKPVVRPRDTETTVRGAVYLAGLAVGVWESMEAIGSLVAGGETRFEPAMDEAERERLYGGWQAAVKRVLG